MSGIGKPERETQNRVGALFRDELGYHYLGDWSDRSANSFIAEQQTGNNQPICGLTGLSSAGVSTRGSGGNPERHE